MSWLDDADEIRAQIRGELWNYTPRALQALGFATEEARAMKLDFVGVEHLLLGLLKLGNGIPFNVLGRHGLTLEFARAEIPKFYNGPGSKESPARIPLTARLKRVIETAKKESQAFGHTHYIGTDHLLAAILAETDGVAHKALKSVHIDPQAMRKEILRELAGSGTPPAVGEQKV